VQCDLDSRYRVAIPRSGGGDPEAQTGLGLLYARGGVVGQDFARAQSLIRPAAEAGHPPALVQLDHRYAQQRAEEPKSGPPPLACYRAAAERGHVEAQSILACNYLNGPGVQ
jgi:TPR repeat protein